MRLAAGASGSHRWSKTGNAVGYVWLSQPIIRPRRPQRTAQQTLSLRSALFAARACRVQEHVQHTRVVVQRGAAVLRCALRGSAACVFPPSLPSPPPAFGSPPLRPAPARLALPVRKQPSRPRQCERTAQTHEQFPCEYEPLRENRPSLEYTTRQAAACRFRRGREHLPLISTTALGLSAATHSLSLLQSLGSPPTPFMEN